MPGKVDPFRDDSSKTLPSLSSFERCYPREFPGVRRKTPSSWVQLDSVDSIAGRTAGSNELLPSRKDRALKPELDKG